MKKPIFFLISFFITIPCTAAEITVDWDSSGIYLTIQDDQHWSIIPHQPKEDKFPFYLESDSSTFSHDNECAYYRDNAQAQEAGLNANQVAPDSNEIDCLSETAREYDIWVQWGKPSCWCFAKQCRGDTNGSSFLGKPVTFAELSLFKAAFNQPEELFLFNPGWICADLNHDGFLGRIVTLSDLHIFKRYFNKHEAMVPQCNEEPIYTGPYNYWETP